MKRPKALDLFCCAGGASMGLHRAGFDVTGVDICPQPRYPFQFIQGDALEVDLDGYDFIWASPVCKGYSSLAHYGNNRRLQRAEKWPKQIEATRSRLSSQPALYCIENVKRAPLHTDAFLCGQMFGLPLIRHRLFETNFPWLRPPHVCARRGSTIRKDVYTITGHGGGRSASNQRMNWTMPDGRRAMGIDWMRKYELAEAIPPVYSEFIGRQVLAILEAL